VPSQDRVGGHNGRDLPQDPSTEALALRGEASALVVGQPEAASLQLPLEDAVFLDQVFDDVLLVAIDPSGEGHEQHLQGVDISRHGSIVPCLIPDPVTGSGPAEFSDTTRADFYGAPMKLLVHEAMRGPSAWSVGDRELMAAFVSKVNECEFCTKAHAAVAERAYRDGAKVSAVLSNLETASIEEPLPATLRMLGKLTREHAVDADDMRAVLAAGASREQIEDALAVCFAFNTVNRLADAFGFFVPGPQAFEAGAKFLLARGYR
jgi:uncharacterized peroxidase-related enzyme